MAKYTITHSCGHESAVQLYGKHTSREKRIEYLEGRVCDLCYITELQRKRNKENAAAAAANAEAGLPDLTGSEKQIAWAETIRRQKLDTLNSMIKEGRGRRLDPERREAAIENIRNRNSARWWIDNRDTQTRQILQEEYDRTDKPIPADETTQAAEIEAELLVEATVRPENPVTETVADIKTSDNIIRIVFPELNEEFRKLVRYELGYKWQETHWQRKLNFKNGDLKDRVAEVGHRLLAAGFVIRIFDAEIRERAVNGEYEQEGKRWVLAVVNGKRVGWFFIEWPRSDDFYTAARRLPGSRYSKPGVVVPPEQFEQVLDFAERYEFRLSKKASAIAETAKQARDAALVAHPAEKSDTAPKAPQSRVPAELLIPENVQVPDEFKD